MTPFIEGTFSNKFKGLDRYETSARPLGRLSRNLPSTIFYSRLLLGPLQWLCRRAAKGHNGSSHFGKPCAAGHFYESAFGPRGDGAGLQNRV